MRLVLAIGMAAAILVTYLVITDRARLAKRLEQVERAQAAARQERESAPAATAALPPLELLARAVGTVPVVAAPAASAPVAKEPNAPVEEAADPGPSKEEFSASLDDFFAQQPPSTSNSRTLRSTLQDWFAKLQLPAANLPEVDCRGSMCKAEFPKLDEAHARDLLMQVTSLGWPGPLTAFMVDGNNGAKQVRLFAAAAGSPLPMPHG